MLNIRQTSLYAQFMRRINWQVEKIDGVFIYVKKLPLIPAVIKIQRPNKLPSLKKLTLLAKKYKAKSIIIEPSPNLQPTTYNLQLLNDPYIHTKSFHVDLTVSEYEIFNRFSSAKRRSVRRAQNLGVKVEISDNIEAFIKLKNHTTGIFLGFLTTRGVTRPLWQTFAPKHAKVLLAYINSHSEQSEESSDQRERKNENHASLDSSLSFGMTSQPIDSILLLYNDKTAYYWMEAATKEGKKHFAPTLLTWEAFKFAKKQGCTTFDFEGVYDERFPKRARDWQGFSKFKEGFGGIPVYYPQPYQIRF